MTYIDDENIMYAVQVAFRVMRRKKSPEQSADELIYDQWLTDEKQEFQSWLQSQGCVVVKHPRPILRNSLGIAAGYDRFGFESESDATMFVLRWS